LNFLIGDILKKNLDVKDIKWFKNSSKLSFKVDPFGLEIEPQLSKNPIATNKKKDYQN
jgi:hypothetical protein